MLEALDLFEGIGREPHPSREGFRRVDVNADMLPDVRALQLVIGMVAKKRNRCAGKIQRAAVVAGDHFDDVRIIENVRRRKDRGGADVVAPVGDDAKGALERLPRDEGLVALHVDDCLKVTIRRLLNELGDAFGARAVLRARHCDGDAMFDRDTRHFVAVGCDDDGIRDVELDDALPNADDERQSGEEAKWFSGETGGTQSGWDHGEHTHRSRSLGGGVGGETALTTAKITCSNVGLN